MVMKVTIKQRRNGLLVISPPKWWAIKKGHIKEARQQLPKRAQLLLEGQDAENFIATLPNGIASAVRNRWLVSFIIDRLQFEAYHDEQ